MSERRSDVRRPAAGAGFRATLRPGCLVLLVDVSAGGALVEGARPLRPGARVHLQVVTPCRTFALAAHVLRCGVWAVDPAGVTYRGALKFESRCDWVWEQKTRDGSAVPGGQPPPDEESGHGLPAPPQHPRARLRQVAK